MNYWRMFDYVTIFYAPTENVEIDGVKYRSATVVDANDKKAVQTMQTNYSCGGTKPVIQVTTSNDAFNVEIGGSSGVSTNGKTSFWECIITKAGMQPFVVVIPSEYIIPIIRQHELNKGLVKNEMFFAKHGANLALLDIYMNEYQDYMKDIQHKQQLRSASKTSKWEIGKVYYTLKTADIYLGQVKHIFNCTIGGKNPKAVFDFNVAPTHYIVKYDKDTCTDLYHCLDEVSKKYWISQELQTLPSRIEGTTVFTQKDYSLLTEFLHNVFVQNKDKIGWPPFMYAMTVLRTIMLFFENDKDSIIDIMQTCVDHLNDDFYDVSQGLEPTYYTADSLSKKETVEVWVDGSLYKTCNSAVDFWYTCIDICVAHL